MTLLHAEHVSLSYGETKVLRSVSMQLQRGEVLGLIGPNGAGKTTLLRILAALQLADKGEVFWQGQSLMNIPLKQRAHHIGYLAQGAPAHWPLRVEKVVALGRLPHQQPWQRLSSEDKDVIESAIDQTDIGHLRQRIITTLSGGERMRVLLARLFASQPQLVLADEPVAALDPYHQLHIMELLHEHAHNTRPNTPQGAVIVVLHDLNLAARFCDRLLLLKQGKLVAEGKPADVLNPQRLNEAYGIEAKYFEDNGKLAVIPWQRMDSLL